MVATATSIAGATLFAAPASAAAVTVTSAEDQSGACELFGDCTLRGAIERLAAGRGGIIDFSIDSGPQTITLDAPLPPVPAGVVIDARTQDGYAGAPVIELDGSNVTGTGLELTDEDVVLGLAIDRFNGPGIDVKGSGNTIAANYIGTDLTGTLDRGNSGPGIQVEGPSNLIGGEAGGNLISGNGGAGIAVTGSPATGNVISGNWIGTKAGGTGRLANDGDGVSVTDAASTHIGGTSAAARNVISGNSGNGVATAGAATGTVVEGNYVGTNAAGKAAIGNHENGVRLGSGNNTVGSAIAEGRNVISGNTLDGVLIAADANHVGGNYIGVDAPGKRALGNHRHGIDVFTNGNEIGRIMGTYDPGPANVVSGNLVGIEVSGWHNTIGGNVVGVNAQIRAPLGNSLAGIAVVAGGSFNMIGGPSFYDENWIGGNYFGVELTGAGPDGHDNVVTNNHIGIDNSGTWIGNTGDGIRVGLGTTHDTIGPNNIIAHNGGAGVNIAPFETVETPATNIRITQSHFDANAGLAIDLYGVGANDPGDADTGYNMGQNFPVIRSAVVGSIVKVRARLSSKPNKTYRIELFYVPSSCDPSGYGEGSFAASKLVTTGADGTVTFTMSFGKNWEVFPGQFVTATATDPSGNTSEFSACQTIAPGPVVGMPL